MNSITLPLTNVLAKGDFTATLYLGSEQTPVNLIIDTGSSTLVVKPSLYQPSQDKSLAATAIVQEVNYGIGGWAGALVHSQLTFQSPDQSQNQTKDQHHQVSQQHKTQVNEQKSENTSSTCVTTSIAIVEAEPSNTFGDADGIFGLAYHHLNKSFDLNSFFTQHNISPALSLPWPFLIGDKCDPEKVTEFKNLKAFKSFLWQYPEHDVKPLFSQIADQHIVEDRFSFYAKRSSIHVSDDNINAANPNEEQVKQLTDDPLNQGQLLLGGGEAQTHLYQGGFKAIKVFHDIYYNVKLVSVTVGNNQPIEAKPLAKSHEHAYFTNAIIDTGASLNVLPQDLFQQIFNQLVQVNPQFEQLLTPFAEISQQYQGIDMNALDLNLWPDLIFTFIGENEEPVELICPPTHYWQTNTPSKGKACFKLLSQLPNWPNQSIIGLPLITNYYTVFDRGADTTGVIKFASQAC